MAYNFPPVNKVFDDLDKFRDFCRFEGEGYPFDEKDLYNTQSPVWQAYQRFLQRKFRPRFNKNNNNRDYQNKDYQPRKQFYTRSN